MGNLLIVPYNDHDYATLTTSASPVSAFPATNTQNTVRKKSLRTTSLSSFDLKGTFAANRVASHFSLHWHLLHGASVRLQLYSDAAWSTGVYDSTALPTVCYTATGGYTWSTGTTDPRQYRAPYWLHFTETTYRSYKITFSGTPSGGYSYFDISRVWLGRYFQLAVNPDFGMKLGRVDITKRNRSMGGSNRTNSGESWRTLTCDLNGVNAIEVATWEDILDYCGTGRDVVVSVFPGDGTRKEALHTIAGKFVNLDGIGHQVSRFTNRLQLEEN